MDIKTKFDIGDKLFFIACNTFIKHEKCLACNGTGRIMLRDGDTTYCPKCYEKGYNEVYGDENWHVLENEDDIEVSGKDFYKRPIGQIRIEVAKKKVEIMYQLKNTGNLFNEENSFKTLEEAKEECNKRNLLLKNN